MITDIENLYLKHSDLLINPELALPNLKSRNDDLIRDRNTSNDDDEEDDDEEDDYANYVSHALNNLH
jgi:hypothetical protein